MNAPPSPRTQLELPEGLRVSAFDRTAGMIIALLFLVGFGVIVLVLLWLAGRALAGDEQPPVALLAEAPSDGMTSLGMAREMVEPGVEEFADVTNPQLADSLAAVTTAVTLQQATLDELFGDSSQMGTGQGDGNSNARGSGGNGNDETSSPVRALSLRTTSLTRYARMLDSLGIELGVLGGGLDGITYVSRFNADKPVVRNGTGEKENRFYFSQDSQLVELDRQLLATAGIDSHNRVIVYFVPPRGEQQILAAERGHAGKMPEEILSTTFGVRAIDDDGHEFFVIRQEPRP